MLRIDVVDRAYQPLQLATVGSLLMFELLHGARLLRSDGGRYRAPRLKCSSQKIAQVRRGKAGVVMLEGRLLLEAHACKGVKPTMVPKGKNEAQNACRCADIAQPMKLGADR